MEKLLFFIEKWLCRFNFHRLTFQNGDSGRWHCYCYKAIKNNDYPSNPDRKRIKDWEDEFDKQFYGIAGVRFSGIEVKDFISSLLSQQRNELIKEIEEIVGKKRHYALEEYDHESKLMSVGFNSALDEITQAIKKVGDKKINIWKQK